MPITGRISGSLMYRTFCHFVAPAMSAASVRSSGMFWSAAKNIMVGMPTHCQDDTRATAVSAYFSSPSQG